MASQSIERRRCLSCNRWGGARQPGLEADMVDYDENDEMGPCQEGPWHGSLRRGPRNACGHWLKWKALDQAVVNPSSPPTHGPESPAA